MSDDTQSSGRVPINPPAWGQWLGEPHEAQAITVDVGLVPPPASGGAAEPAEPPALDSRPCGTATFGGDGGEFDVGVGVRFHIGERTP